MAPQQNIPPQGTAQTLDPATQATMADRFSHNFSDVRIYADDRAAESATALNARAYTTGRDITFGAGQYAPQTGAGRHLIAHELTHVVQNDQAIANPANGVSSAGDTSEREAAAVAEAVATDAPLPMISATPAAAIQRDPADSTTPAPPAAPPAGQPAGQPASPNGQQNGQQGNNPTPEFFNLAGVLDAKNAMSKRADDLAAYATLALATGDWARIHINEYSSVYKSAYTTYANIVKAAREEANTENVVLGVAIGVALGVAAAFALPATAAGWFTLTASDAAIAVGSGLGQAAAGYGLSKLVPFAGGNLEPGGLTPAEQQLNLWKTVTALYRAAGAQIGTLQNLAQIVNGAEFLVGEIRAQVAGGQATMSQDQVLDKVEFLINSDQAMAREDAAGPAASLADLRAFNLSVQSMNPQGVGRNEIEQNIWILWMATLTDAAVLDRDPIEDHLHAIHVLGKSSRLGVDFGIYTFWWDENAARDAAVVEAKRLQDQAAALRPPAPPAD